MGLLCKIKGHNWDGCKCTRCNETRDAEHRFEPVEGKCVKRCSRCGKEMEIPHSWENEGCMQRCTVCGLTRTNHKWRNHRCRVCGAYDEELEALFNKEYVNCNDISVNRFLDGLDQKTLTELALKAKDTRLHHEAWERVTKPRLLAKIKDETSNDYIRGLISEKFQCPHCGSELSVDELEKCKCGSCGKAVHDYIDVDKVEHDGRLFESGVRYKRCRRCGHTTKPREYMHHWD